MSPLSPHSVFHPVVKSLKSSFYVPPTPKLAHPTWNSISSQLHVQAESLESGM